MRYSAETQRQGIGPVDEDVDGYSSASSTISAPLRTFGDDSDGLKYAHTFGGRLPRRAYRSSVNVNSQDGDNAQVGIEENDGAPASLSQLISRDAANGWLRRNSGGRRSGVIRNVRINSRSMSGFRDGEPHERTPLKSTARRRASYDEEESNEAGRDVIMTREEDMMFGPWPGRLLNRYVSVVTIARQVLLTRAFPAFRSRLP